MYERILFALNANIKMYKAAFATAFFIFLASTALYAYLSNRPIVSAAFTGLNCESAGEEDTAFTMCYTTDPAKYWYSVDSSYASDTPPASHPQLSVDARTSLSFTKLATPCKTTFVTSGLVRGTSVPGVPLRV